MYNISMLSSFAIPKNYGIKVAVMEGVKNIMKGSRGFTLIELIIIIAIIAVLFTIAVPSFMAQRNDAKLRDATNMIKADLEVARSWAIRENAFTAILLSNDGYTIFIDNGSGGGVADNWARDGNEKTLFNRKLSAGTRIDLTMTTFDTNRTRFNGKGYITNNGLLSLLSSDGKHATIDMNNRFGRISTY